MDSKYWRLPSCYVVEQHRSSTVKGDPEEFKRISQLEGTLTTDSNNNMRIKPPIRTLSASRAFGDWDLAKYIKPIPSITRYALKDTDKSLVLACDGFWDEMNTNSEPFDHIKNFEYIEEKSNTLVAYALYKRSQDNITIIIIDIQKLRGKLN